MKWLAESKVDSTKILGLDKAKEVE